MKNALFWLLCFLQPSRARRNLIAYMNALARRYLDRWPNGTEFLLFNTLTTGKLARYELPQDEVRRLKWLYWASRRYWWHFPEYAEQPILVNPQEWSVLLTAPPKIEISYANGLYAR